MELYHYCSLKLTEILTLEEQWKRGMPFVEEKDKYKKYGYHKHVSLTIDKIPIQLIKDKFPESSPYKRGGVLYEHIIETDEIKNMMNYEISESPLNLRMDDLWWGSKIRQKIGEDGILDDVFSHVQDSIKSVINEKGTTIQSLNKAIAKFKNTIEPRYIDWTNRPTFDEESTRMYSPYIPHVQIYLNPGILRPKSIKQVL